MRAGQGGSVKDMYHSAIAWPGIRLRTWGDDVPWSYSGMRGKRMAEVYLPGCNLKCDFCIAPYLIRMGEVRGMQWIEPADLVRKIIGSADALGFSGGEGSIHVEYVTDVFSQCQDHGIRTILETNGYMTKGTAEKLAKYTNHVSFGLKASLDQAYYKHNLGIEEAEPIREAAKVFAENGCEVILTNLTDPNLWDDRLAFETLTKWIARDLGIEVRLALGSLERGELPPPWTEERIHITPREQRHAHLEGYRKVAMDAGLQRVFCILCSPRVGRQPQTREPLTTAIDFD